MLRSTEIFVGLQYRDRLSIGQNRADLGHHAFHWSILVFDGRYHRFDVTDGIVQDQVTLQDINPDRVWVHRHLVSDTLTEIPRYLGSVSIGNVKGSSRIEQIVNTLTEVQASQLNERSTTSTNCFKWAGHAIRALQDVDYVQSLDVGKLQDFALNHADRRLADFKNTPDPVRYSSNKAVHKSSCIVI